MKAIRHLAVLLSTLFFSLSLSAQQSPKSCSEQAFAWIQATGFYFPLSDSVANCVEAEIRRLDPPADENARLTCISGLIALGNDYGNKKKSYLAVQRLARAERLLRDGTRQDSFHQALIYNLLGFYAKEFFQFDLAELYNARSLELSERLGNTQGVLEQLINLSEIYVHTGKHRKSEEAVFEADSMLRELSGQVPEPMLKTAELFANSNLAYTYIDEGRKQKLDFDDAEADVSYESAIQTFKQMLPTARMYAPQRVANCYESIGVLYTRKKISATNTDSALVYLEKYLAIPQDEKVAYLSAAHQGYVLCTYGGALARKGRFDEGLQKNAEGLATLGYPVADAFVHPAVPKNIRLPEAQFLLNSLLIRGEILYGQHAQTKDVKYLIAAADVLARAAEASNQLAADQISDQSMLAYRTLFQMLYASAAAYSAELYQTTKNEAELARSFDFAEQSRATVLRHHLWTTYDLALRDGPESVYRKREDYYRGKIHEYQQQESLADSLLLISKQFGQFIDTLRRSSYPGAQHYYQNRFNRSTLSLAALRSEMLDDTTAFISYLWAYPKHLVYYATKQEAGVEFLDLDTQFLEDCDNLIETGLKRAANSDFKISSNRLYDKLLKNLLEKPRMERVKRLVIAPDNVLREISFDALLTEPPTDEGDEVKYSWLIQNYVTNYQYSATVWNSLKLRSEQLRRRSAGKQARLAAFIADYRVGSSKFPVCEPFIDLTKMKDTIKKVFAKHRVFAPAQVRDFFTSASTFDLLHFVMHTCSPQAESPLDYSLFFSNDQRLTIADIYRQRLDAQVAVFGSCDIESGENKAGEGLIGIARAFNFAGCPNLVATLHSVPDPQTAEISELFYKNLLSKKMPADAALAYAKRAYLAKEGTRKFPHFWGNMICIGEAAKFD
jgi:CHAT domain-containing protein